MIIYVSTLLIVDREDKWGRGDPGSGSHVLQGAWHEKTPCPLKTKQNNAAVALHRFLMTHSLPTLKSTFN